MFLKGDSNPKHLNFLVIYFNVSNKISSTPLQLLNFRQSPAPPFPPPPPSATHLSMLKKFLTPCWFQLPNPNSLILLGTQELDLGS